MPIAYRLYDCGVVLTTEWGRVTVEEAQQHLRTLDADARIRWPLRELLDKRHISELVRIDYVTSEWFVDETARMCYRGGAGQICFLASSDVLYGQCRQCQIMLELRGVSAAVFRDPAAACVYIGVPAEALDDLTVQGEISPT